MLKRTLTIGFLLVLGVVLAAAGPSAATDGTIEYVTDDGSEAVLFWAEMDSVTRQQAALTDGPDYEPIEIPQDVLARLPAHVRAAFLGDFTHTGAQNINGCVIRVKPPQLSGSNVTARIDISCIYTNVVKTRLQGELRIGSNILDDYDSTWVSWKSHGQTLKDACVPVTHSYTSWVKGSIELNTGQKQSKEYDATRTITCPTGA